MKVHEFFPPLVLEDGRSPAPNGWLHAADLARRSDSRMALEVSGELSGVGVTVCVGPISDAFRTAFYGDVLHPALPEAKSTDAEFEEFLAKAEKATDAEFAQMLADSVV